MQSEHGQETHSRIGVEIACARCSKVVLICQCCWRNQKYCSEGCSKAATLERHRRNQKAYRLTLAGRENHKAQQRTYRERKKIQE